MEMRCRSCLKITKVLSEKIAVFQFLLFYLEMVRPYVGVCFKPLTHNLIFCPFLLPLIFFPGLCLSVGLLYSIFFPFCKKQACKSLEITCFPSDAAFSHSMSVFPPPTSSYRHDFSCCVILM